MRKRRLGPPGYLVLAALGAIALQMSTSEVSACVGARSVALGEAYVAVAEGPEASYWNPAGLAFSAGRGLLATGAFSDWESYNNDAFIAYSEGYNGKLAGSLSLSYDGIDRQQGVIAYSLATRVGGKLAIGATLKHEQEWEATGDESSSRHGKGWGVDAGLLATIGDRATVGFMVQDAGGMKVKWDDGTSYEYAMNVRVGASYKPVDGALVTAELYNATAVFTAASPEAAQFRLGAEYEFGVGGSGARLALRAGGSKSLDNAASVLTAGLGVKVTQGMRLDYAYRKYMGDGDPNGVHLVGVGVSF